MEKNSCLMLAMSLETPVSLDGIINDLDLGLTVGIETEPHVTILYAPALEIDRSGILETCQTILGPESWSEFKNFLKDTQVYPLENYFELDTFENPDKDWLILKLREGTEIYDLLSVLNKGLTRKYDVQSDFDSYQPHLTLAELKPGRGRKYLGSEGLAHVLSDSMIGFEDLVFSLGETGKPHDRLQWNLTTWHALDRYFRQSREAKERENKEL